MATIRDNAVILKGDIKSVLYEGGSSNTTKGFV